MAALARRAGGLGDRVGLALLRISWRTPEWWVAAATLAAWGAILISAVSPETPLSHASHVHPASPARTEPRLLVEVYCVFGMMVPLVLPTLRRVAIASLWARRNQAVLACLGGYLAMWIASSQLLGALIDGLSALSGPIATLALTSGVALAWQLSSSKRRALRGCHLTLPLTPSGWRADRDCVGLGVAVGWSCVVNCWALMAVVIASGHHAAVMAVALAAMVIERFGRNAFRDAAIAIAADLRFALVTAQPAGGS